MRRYGLIGKPLGHSVSARWFGEKFARERIEECRYDLFELASIGDLPRLLSDTPGLCGFNVTTPYKKAIIPFLDTLTPEAERIGAVNCVRIEGRKLTGFNTDVSGLRTALAALLGSDCPEEALVLGTGGASEAVQYVLAELGIPFSLVSRDAKKGNYTYDDLPCHAVASDRLIVNATPIGMFPHADTFPCIPYGFITPSHYLLDLVYNPPLTQFLDYGRQRGAKIQNGWRMFTAQAEVSWRIWNE